MSVVVPINDFFADIAFNKFKTNMVLKENKPNGAPVVKWIGSTNEKIVDVPRLAHKEVSYYQKCILGDFTLSLGDFILVSNADAAEPDTVDGCDIGKILCLYELHEAFVSDPYRAIVQWYSRPECVPHKEFDRDDICIDFNNELIEEYRPYDPDISLETIFRKCIVLFGGIEESANAILHKYNAKRNNCPMFVCRYKFIKEKKTYRLVPLDGNTDDLAATTESAAVKSRGRKKSYAEDSPDTNTKEKKSARIARSASARKQKVNADVAVRKRRASVAAATALEFIDCNVYGKEDKVSPIKIIGGRNVVRLSANKKIATDSDAINTCIPTSPLTERNRKAATPTARVTAARRNLNLSLENGADTNIKTDYLNYSIVRTPSTGEEETASDMKIKLRLSAKQRASKLAAMDEHFNDPLCMDVEAGQRAKSTPEEIYSTPTKKSKRTSDDVEMTPTNRRKSILKSATRRQVDSTPKRSIQLSDIVEKRVFNDEDYISTPKRKPKGDDNDIKRSALKNATISRRRNSTTAVAGAMTPTQKLKLMRRGELSPTMEHRHTAAGNISQKKSELQLARERLHVSVVPQSLPCREKEFDNVYAFLEGKIQDQCGGCMYVSGVPGTGKTATVTGVIRMLQRKQQNDELPDFEFVEINGMRLTEPRQAYVQIYKQLTGKTVSWEHAHSLLEKRFTTPAPRRITTVLLVDELDILCNRRQDVVYNLLDWPTKSAARLVVVTIANTMDLPERLLMGKVTSRLGLTRLTFQPYSHKQLQEIVTMRLCGSDAFKSDAVQLVARKVAAVSGDARRALDICRRATEIAEAAILPMDSDNAKPIQKFVSIAHVQQALSEMIASAKVQAIKNCSRLEQIFLQAVLAEVTRTGVEETSFLGVYAQVENLAAFEGITVPTPGNCLRICSKLCAERLLIAESGRNDIFQKILLNISVDDIHYALRVKGI